MWLRVLSVKWPLRTPETLNRCQSHHALGPSHHGDAEICKGQHYFVPRTLALLLPGALPSSWELPRPLLILSQHRSLKYPDYLGTLFPGCRYLAATSSSCGSLLSKEATCGRPSWSGSLVSFLFIIACRSFRALFLAVYLFWLTSSTGM